MDLKRPWPDQGLQPSGQPISPIDPEELECKRDWKNERITSPVVSATAPTPTPAPLTTAPLSDFDLSAILTHSSASPPTTSASLDTQGLVPSTFVQVGDMGSVGVFSPLQQSTASSNSALTGPNTTDKLIFQPTLTRNENIWPRFAPEWGLPSQTFFSQFSKKSSDDFTKTLSSENFMRANRVANVHACRLWQRGECNLGATHTTRSGIPLIHACILCLRVSQGVPMYHKLHDCPLVVKPTTNK